MVSLLRSDRLAVGPFWDLLDRGEEACGAAGGAEQERFVGEAFDLGLEGVREIRGQHVSHLVHEVGIGGEGGDFEIQAERAIVEVGGADGGEAFVDEHHFLV